MITPVNNHCLIEVIDEFGGVLRDRKTEDRKRGKVLAYSFDIDHITASTGYSMTAKPDERRSLLEQMIGKTVLYQQYADEGQTFDGDGTIGEAGKKYAVVYWWRIMAVVEPEAAK